MNLNKVIKKLKKTTSKRKAKELINRLPDKSQRTAARNWCKRNRSDLLSGEPSKAPRWFRRLWLNDETTKIRLRVINENARNKERL